MIEFDYDKYQVRHNMMERLQRILDDNDITRKELAYMLKIPKTTIDHWFEDSTITMYDFYKVCDGIGISATYLLLGIGRKYIDYSTIYTRVNRHSPYGGLPQISASAKSLDDLRRSKMQSSGKPNETKDSK